MDRRRFLATLSTALPLAVAGCMSGRDNDSTTTTTTTTTTSTTTSTTSPTTTTTTPPDSGPMALGETASLSGDRALAVLGGDTSAFAVTRTDGSLSVRSMKNKRYVRVSFDPDNLADREAFVRENVTLTINDTDYGNPVFPVGGGFNRFTAAYPVPADLVPYTASVSLDTGEASATWAFDARAIGDISQIVDYTVQSLTVPESVEAEADFTGKLTVENAASDPLQFVCMLKGTANAPTRHTFGVPGSTTKTYEFDATAPAADGASEFDVTVDWGYKQLTKTIPYK